ncbi:MAG: hypothetical protein Q7R41_07485 [Phycisphaerales bacterium]|jgi:hypothetical protein|nr:hypothetical protein [Phycisphaerales bacterium]
MNEMSTKRPMQGVWRHRTLMAAGLGALLLGAVAVAAAARGWLATTTIAGKVVDSRELTVPRGGSATYSVPVNGAREATFTVTSPPSEGSGQVTVKVNSDGTTANAEVKDEQKAGNP